MTFPQTIETQDRTYRLLPADCHPIKNGIAVYEYHVDRTWEFISVDRHGTARNHLGLSWLISAIACLSDEVSI